MQQNIKLITILLYALFDLGLVLLFYNSFQSLYYSSQLKRRLKTEDEDTNDSMFMQKLNIMLHVALNTRDDSIALQFVMLSAGLALLAFVVFTALFQVGLGIFAAIAAALLPYLIVRVKLQNFQVEISKEGEILISALLSNYLTNNHNIREAIARTAIDLDGAPRSKKAMLDLARSLTSATSKREVEDALEIFRYSFDTSWGDILTTNIRFAFSDGIVITNALKDLSAGITNAMRSYEANKRENNEAGIMLKYFFPVLCILVYFGAVGLFEFTPQMFFYYQFQTSTGVAWTILIFVLYVVCVLVTNKLTKIKMDL